MEVEAGPAPAGGKAGPAGGRSFALPLPLPFSSFPCPLALSPFLPLPLPSGKLGKSSEDEGLEPFHDPFAGQGAGDVDEDGSLFELQSSQPAVFPPNLFRWPSLPQIVPDSLCGAGASGGAVLTAKTTADSISSHCSVVMATAILSTASRSLALTGLKSRNPKATTQQALK